MRNYAIDRWSVSDYRMSRPPQRERRFLRFASILLPFLTHMFNPDPTTSIGIIQLVYLWSDFTSQSSPQKLAELMTIFCESNHLKKPFDHNTTAACSTSAAAGSWFDFLLHTLWPLSQNQELPDLIWILGSFTCFWFGLEYLKQNAPNVITVPNFGPDLIPLSLGSHSHQTEDGKGHTAKGGRELPCPPPAPAPAASAPGWCTHRLYTYPEEALFCFGRFVEKFRTQKILQ